MKMVLLDSMNMVEGAPVGIYASGILDVHGRQRTPIRCSASGA